MSDWERARAIDGEAEMIVEDRRKLLSRVEELMAKIELAEKTMTCPFAWAYLSSARRRLEEE